MDWGGLDGLRTAWGVVVDFINSGLSQHWWTLQSLIGRLGGGSLPSGYVPTAYGPGTQVYTPPGQVQLLGTLGGPSATAPPAPAPAPSSSGGGGLQNEVGGTPINWGGLEGEGYPAPGTRYRNVVTGQEITIGVLSQGGVVTAPAPPEYQWQLIYLPPGAPMPSGYSGVGSVPHY